VHDEALHDDALQQELAAVLAAAAVLAVLAAVRFLKMQPDEHPLLLQ